MVKKRISEFVEGSEKTIAVVVITLVLLGWIVFADDPVPVFPPDCTESGGLRCIYDTDDIAPPSPLSSTYTNTVEGFSLPVTIDGYMEDIVYLRVVDCDSEVISLVTPYGPIDYDSINVNLQLFPEASGLCIIQVFAETLEGNVWVNADSFVLNPAPGQENDFDGDGIPDCDDPDDDNDYVIDENDRCPWTVLPETIPTGGDAELSPNNYADTDGDGIFEINTGSKKNPVIEDSSYTLTDTFGCSCEQILVAKPGDNDGESLHGCSKGTMTVFIKQTGWSADCFGVCGIVEGDSKKIMEDTDKKGMPDILDLDNDNDGVSDSAETDEGMQVDDAQEDGNPDWWCDKNPKKC